MDISIICVLIAATLPYVWQGYGWFRMRKVYSNHAPRNWREKADRKSKRASWAHDNSWEAFAPFAAAVILCKISDVDPYILNSISAGFISCRILHGIFYIYDLATLRSSIWGVGIVMVFTMYILAAY
jgi:uncharacterized MAPEG superfamily protein